MNGIAGLVVLLALSAVPLLLAVPFLAAKRPAFGKLRFLLAALAGFIAVIPAAILQVLFPRLGQSAAGLLLQAFIITAATEEGAKYLALRLFRKRWGDSNNAIPAGISASLAFAFFETVVYASTNPAAIFIRAVTAAPLHAACGSWVGRAAIPPAEEGSLGPLYLLFAIFVHGAYDLTLLVPGFPIAIPILIALGGLLIALAPLFKRPDGDI